MDIIDKSDNEILQIAEPIWDDIVQGTNNKNWALFSKHMPANEINEEARKDIEQH